MFGEDLDEGVVLAIIVCTTANSSFANNAEKDVEVLFLQKNTKYALETPKKIQ